MNILKHLRGLFKNDKAVPPLDIENAVQLYIDTHRCHRKIVPDMLCYLHGLTEEKHLEGRFVVTKRYLGHIRSTTFPAPFHVDVKVMLDAWEIEFVNSPGMSGNASAHVLRPVHDPSMDIEFEEQPKLLSVE